MDVKLIICLSFLICAISASAEDKPLDGVPEHDIPENKDPNKGSVTYIRWGRTVCPAGAEVVYKGYAGGQDYLNAGGGANMLCLPETPEWGKVVQGNQMYSGWIGGVEYKFHSGYEQYPFSSVNANNMPLLDNDAVCVVCLVPSKSVALMIPAKTTCMAGWRKEYSGYLASQNHEHKRGEYICLDEAPEIRGGNGCDKRNGALLYPVQATCSSSLACPPYVQGWELACIVCSK